MNEKDTLEVKAGITRAKLLMSTLKKSLETFFETVSMVETRLNELDKKMSKIEE